MRAIDLLFRVKKIILEIGKSVSNGIYSTVDVGANGRKEKALGSG